MLDLTSPLDPNGKATDETLFRVLTQVGLALRMPVDLTDIQVSVSTSEDSRTDSLDKLIAGAKRAGIFPRESILASADEAIGFVREGHPVIIAYSDGSFVVLERPAGRKVEASVIDSDLRFETLSRRQLDDLLQEGVHRCFVCKGELECRSLSAAPSPHATKHPSATSHHHDHPTPLRRFLALLDLDRRDIFTVVLFAFVAGVLTLATPLAIESLVNVVSWGTYLQPLIVLGLMLLTCLGLAGVLKVLQTVLIEIIQRRQFVRIVSDLAHRFPRANQQALEGEYPRELANRVFDIMTIQKATSVLLFDGVTIVLTTFLGMVLLAFYHPFLLGFDIVLLIAMISITWILGRNGIRSSIDESITKYRVAHWLQDVIASPSVFKTGGGESLAVQRANHLTADYIAARQGQFRVVLRQVAFAISLQVIASTALLALGGWLVIDGQLTLGQLVASELVVTVVVGAFAKAGKSIEKFYDLMAGIDKVGHLIDVPTDARMELGQIAAGPAEVEWGDLAFSGPSYRSRIPAATIEAGRRVAIVGDDVNGRSLLARAVAGLVTPGLGLVQVAGFDATHVSGNSSGQIVGYAGGKELFHGTICENVDLGRYGIGQDQVRFALRKVGLADVVVHLPDGLETQLQTGGYPLNELQTRKLILARAVVAEPRLLIIDGLLDDLAPKDRQAVWNNLTADDTPWTLIVNTNRDDVAALCNDQINIRMS
jgi:putative ABC transport system ATP-binding protein